jgi:DtxR family Mn-dependent transcriptional regulator
MLQYMLDRDFRLDEPIEVLERDPFDGPITVRVSGQQRMIGHNIASCILVEPHPTVSSPSAPETTLRKNE